MKNIKLKLFFSMLVLVTLAMSRLASADDNSAYWRYSIKEGSNLWQFANQHLSSPKYIPKLQKINHIKNPDKIQKETEIKVPFEWVKQQAGLARVQTFSGKVTVTDPKLGSRNVSINESLANGSSIKTADNSQLILVFADGSTLTLESNTQVVLDNMVYFPTTGASTNNISVGSGRVSNEVSKPMLMNNRYQIQTPSAITAVRGTVLTVGVGAEQQTITSVLSGKVKITNGTQSEFIPAGYGAIAGINNAPKEPEKLLPPPDLSNIAGEYNYNKPYLSWQAVKDAAIYHVKLYSNDAKASLLREDSQSTPYYFPENLADGAYRMKVFSRKANGLEGKSETVDFAVRVSHPPLVLSLKDDIVDDKETTKFMFSEHNTPLLIQLWQGNKNTIDTLAKLVAAGANYTHKIPIKSGKWYWRVARFNFDGSLQPYSSIRTINSADGNFHMPHVKKDTISAEVLPIKNVAYKLIIARDKNFTDVVFQQKNQQPDWTLPDTLPKLKQTYWAKIELLTDNGYFYTYPTEELHWQ